MIRKAKIKTVFEILEYTGNNWEEMDEFAGQKGRYDSLSGNIIYIINGCKETVCENDYLYKAPTLEGTVEYGVFGQEFIKFAFELLPLPIEEKITTEFNAKEEM